MGTVLRCYFHLVNGLRSIRDRNGVEVDDVEDARQQAKSAVDELRQSGEVEETDWIGWTLEVVDETDNLLFFIKL